MATAPVVPWLLAAIVAAIVTHAYLWKRWVRDPAFSVPVTRALTCVVVLLGSSLPVGMLGLLYMRVLPRGLAAPLMTAAFGHVGFAYFSLFMLLCVEPWAFTDIKRSGSRRRAAITLTLAVSLTALATVEGLRLPRVEQTRVHLRSLAADLEGYRIVHLSDLHVGPTLGLELVEHIVADTNAQQPDLVVITGDVVDGTPEQLASLLAPLRSLRARDGVFMVFGNHEYLSGPAAWREAFPSLGVRVLRNQRVVLRRGLELIGIDDALPEGGADLALAFADLDRRATSIVAVHEPAVFEDTQRIGGSLQLSGHTHGGQIFPLHLWAWLDQGYLRGLYQLGESVLHVSPGAGFWGPPMRLGSRSEISLLVLTR